MDALYYKLIFLLIKTIYDISVYYIPYSYDRNNLM